MTASRALRSANAFSVLSMRFSKLADACVTLHSAKQSIAFLDVLDRDTHDATLIELVRAQQAISSRLIESLNASIHLRAVLTDLFLLSDVAGVQMRAATAAQ